MKEDLKPLLWTARTWGMIIVAILLYLAVTELIEDLPDQTSPLASLINWMYHFLPWTIAGLGLILALWKEGLGGGISLISFIIGFSPIGFDAKEPVGLIMTIIFFLLTSIPSILYLIYWWKVFHYNRKKVFLIF